jgi:hypothetical protein
MVLASQKEQVWFLVTLYRNHTYVVSLKFILCCSKATDLSGSTISGCMAWIKATTPLHGSRYDATCSLYWWPDPAAACPECRETAVPQDTSLLFESFLTLTQGLGGTFALLPHMYACPTCCCRVQGSDNLPTFGLIQLLYIHKLAPAPNGNICRDLIKYLHINIFVQKLLYT